MPPHLGLVKDDVVNLLIEKKIYDIHVEIVKRDLVFNPSLFPLAPQAPIIVAFKNIKARLIGILNKMILTQWRVLCPLNVRSNHKTARPALVILVDPNSFGNCHGIAIALKAELSKILMDEDIKDDVEVEFLPGNLSLLGGGVSYEQRVNTGDSPAIRWSVGIRGYDGEENLGGYATLTQDGKVIKGVLTSYHAVRPSPNDQNLSTLQSFDQYGRLEQTAIKIESLAQRDRDATLADLDVMINGKKIGFKDIATRSKKTS